MNEERGVDFSGNPFLQQVKTAHERRRLNLRDTMREIRRTTAIGMLPSAFGQGVGGLNNDARHAVRIPALRTIGIVHGQIGGKTYRLQNGTIGGGGKVYRPCIVADVRLAKTQNRRALPIADFVRQVEGIRARAAVQSGVAAQHYQTVVAAPADQQSVRLGVAD